MNVPWMDFAGVLGCDRGVCQELNGTGTMLVVDCGEIRIVADPHLQPVGGWASWRLLSSIGCMTSISENWTSSR